jgi:hypothetical protein
MAKASLPPARLVVLFGLMVAIGTTLRALIAMRIEAACASKPHNAKTVDDQELRSSAGRRATRALSHHTEMKRTSHADKI